MYEILHFTVVYTDIYFEIRNFLRSLWLKQMGRKVRCCQKSEKSKIHRGKKRENLKNVPKLVTWPSATLTRGSESDPIECCLFSIVLVVKPCQAKCGWVEPYLPQCHHSEMGLSHMHDSVPQPIWPYIMVLLIKTVGHNPWSCRAFWKNDTEVHTAADGQSNLLILLRDYSNCACGFGVRKLFNLDSFCLYCIIFTLTVKGWGKRSTSTTYYNQPLPPFLFVLLL